jgi:hypothetical protein
VASLERELWAGGFAAGRLPAYQAAWRELEDLLAAGGEDRRHSFVIIVPVAERPQHLEACLASLLELCEAYGYGGRRGGRYAKVAVLIADDSRDASAIAAHRELARRFGARGLECEHFGPDEQLDLLRGHAPHEAPARLLGRGEPDGAGSFGHKGQGVMRNIAYLKAANVAKVAELRGAEPLLFYSIDSDQEFKVKVATADGERDVHAVNFLARLDEVFAGSDAEVLTGKVVGDPPVSPAVMMGNFLADVIAFVETAAAGEPDAACPHHGPAARREGEAAYHDMAELFGFRAAADAYAYSCPLPGAHDEADCFAHFAGRLTSFFYGEHPTRVSRYVHDELWRTVQPARTVYAGNYVFRPSALRHVIPFAAMRLRMSGPTLGRLIRAEIGPRFVSANLPMLHKRTVADTGQSEFRPGIRADSETIDLCGEFERQFFGDVTLFTVERLTGQGFPAQALAAATIDETFDAVLAEMSDRYAAKQTEILAKLARLEALLDDPRRWWNRDGRHAGTLGAFRRFAANVARNFGKDSPCYRRIEAPESRLRWRADLLAAIHAYPEEARAWRALVAARAA